MIRAGEMDLTGGMRSPVLLQGRAMKLNMIVLRFALTAVTLFLYAVPVSFAQPPESESSQVQPPEKSDADDSGTVQSSNGTKADSVAQPPRTIPPRTTRPRQTAPRRRSLGTGRRPPALQRLTARRYRLARAPDMLGDSFLPPLQLTYKSFVTNGISNAQVPLAVAGGSGRSKIGEFNKALPSDRVFASYNHFHNAATQGFSPARSGSVDRFTLGAERTLLDGDTSIEVRLPLTQFPTVSSEIAGAGPFGGVVSGAGTLGNVSLIGKHLFVDQDDLLVSAGLGIELPLGDDGVSEIAQVQFVLENETVFLQPFVAATLDNGTTWLHSFLQVDIDTMGNSLSTRNLAVTSAPVTSIGRLTQRTLIHFDVSAGQWLYRDNTQSGITGVAAIAEVHVSAAASSQDVLLGDVTGQSGSADIQLNSSSAFPQTYLTTGIHTEINGRHMLRIAGVFPVASRERRLFDAEVLVQFGTRY